VGDRADQRRPLRPADGRDSGRRRDADQLRLRGRRLDRRELDRFGAVWTANYYDEQSVGTETVAVATVWT
jgi:hypothetical protein